MPARRKRRKNSGSGCLRALGFIFLAAIFVAAALFLTSQRNTPEKQSVHEQHPQVTDRRHKSKPSGRHDIRSEEHNARKEESPANETPHPAPEVMQTQPGATPETSASKPDIEIPIPKPVSPRPKVLVFPGEFAHGDKSSRQIALTFDAGASSAPTPEILDTLTKHNVHATFFLTGKWMKKNPGLTRRIAAEGHIIGNHTYNHRSLTELDSGEITKEVEKTDQLVMDLTGQSTKPLLRVPYGARDKRVLSVLNELGYTSVYWDLDSWDSVKAGITSTEIEERILGKVRNGSVILMHCGSQASADALDSMLDKLEAAGYEPVTINELMH